MVRKFIKKNIVCLILAVLLIGSDLLLTAKNPVGRFKVFYPDDFEITLRNHPQKIWNNVIFGNSAIIAAYNENRSGDYVNLGVDYGVITDLKAILQKGYIHVDGELVIALNFFVLYDKMDTNKSYLWHRHWYEPYVYFERDRLFDFINTTFNAVLDKKLSFPNFSDATKVCYYGNMPEDELAEKRENFHRLYWELPIDDFQKNLNALDWLIDYCKKENIKLRAVWMPWSALLDVPEIATQVKSAANEKLGAAGVEILDLTDLLEPEMFHDFGHLTFENGRPYFTDYLDRWLHHDNNE